ncbi:phage integrase SAM-like domain-containing protein [Chryseobacterium taklimakanense]|uniref:phage integrase SAM-like domain-containing protein n=1 Tax=Chryseobacterium taklimakanense TaxID=536441 RepID=UPI001E46D5BB|nr:phage integrase SAM-like domain-containing protein [Chryseobacterium taklimakanense]
MITKLSILFYVKRTKANASGKLPVYLRITVDGSRSELSLKREVDATRWSSEQNKMKGNSEESRKLNTYLDIMRLRVYEIQKDLIHDGQAVTSEAIKNKLLGIDDSKRMLIPIFKDHNTRMEALVGKEYAKGTLTRYKTCLSHIQEFLKWKFKASDVDIAHIDHAFFADFEFFLALRKPAPTIQP